MESALQTAVSALGQALKAKHTEVVLTVGSKTNGAKNGSTEERAYEG
jgi:hypothetical protein